MPNRDDFTPKTKQLLALRVGFRCSNPNCRVTTAGPSDHPEMSINLGVAAHITAASKGGPRFNPNLNGKERRDVNNGIWLCQNCAKLIDSDISRFSVSLLKTWKNESELNSKNELGKNTENSAVSAFQEVLSIMPELLLAMAQALKDKELMLIREFFVLPHRKLILGGSSKPRLIFYEEDYENLLNKLDILEDYGFIDDVRVGNAPIFRISPELVKCLLTDNWST